MLRKVSRTNSQIRKLSSVHLLDCFRLFVSQKGVVLLQAENARKPLLQEYLVTFSFGNTSCVYYSLQSFLAVQQTTMCPLPFPLIITLYQSRSFPELLGQTDPSTEKMLRKSKQSKESGISADLTTFLVSLFAGCVLTMTAFGYKSKPGILMIAL